jgi:hypothetical protein
VLQKRFHKIALVEVGKKRWKMKMMWRFETEIFLLFGLGCCSSDPSCMFVEKDTVKRRRKKTISEP